MPEPEVKPEVTPEPAPVAEPSKIKVEVDGEEVELTPQQLSEALTNSTKLGQYYRYLQSQGVIDEKGNPIKAQPAKKDEVDDDEDEGTKTNKKIAELEERLRKTETETTATHAQNQINAQLAQLGNQFPETKDDPELRAEVEKMVLSQWYLNPNANVASIYSRQVKRFNTVVDKRVKSYIDKKLEQSERKGEKSGGSAGLTLDKPFTADDLRKGNIADALAKRLGEI